MYRFREVFIVNVGENRHLRVFLQRSRSRESFVGFKSDASKYKELLKIVKFYLCQNFADGNYQGSKLTDIKSRFLYFSRKGDYERGRKLS